MSTKSEADDPQFWPLEEPSIFSPLERLERYLKDVKAYKETDQTREWVRDAKETLAARHVLILKEGQSVVPKRGPIRGFSKKWPRLP